MKDVDYHRPSASVFPRWFGSPSEPYLNVEFHKIGEIVREEQNDFRSAAQHPLIP